MRVTSEADCVRALRRAANELGTSPAKAAYEALGFRPASATIIRTFGSWNAAKEAAGLAVNTSTGSRTGPKPDNVDIPDGATWESLTVDQRWHYRNVERNTRRTLERRAELRAWVYGIKQEADGCSRCDEDDPACLEFHHVDAADKTMAVSALIAYEPSEERLLEEIRKCELVCANCHRKEHYEPNITNRKSDKN